MTTPRKKTISVLTWFCGAVLTAGVLDAAATAWTSGAPIPVGTADRRGPLSAGLTSFPVGYARVTGAKQPDLFAVAGKFSPEPGLYLYPWKATTASGVPVFGERQAIRHPLGNIDRPVCTIVEEGGVTWGFFVQGSEIIHARFDRDKREFVETSRQALTGLPRAPQAIAALPRAGGGWSFVVSVPDGNDRRPPGAGSRDMNYVPFDGAGIWRGGTPRFSLWVYAAGSEPKLISRPGEEILWNAGTLSRARFDANHPNDVISGSWFGDIYYYRSNSEKDGSFEQRRHAVGDNGIVLRHPLAGVYPLAYPNPRTGLSDLIAGGEGGLHFYQFTGRFDSQGRPVFRQPVPVLEENARLFAGSLSVPTVVDWDGDGALDIVAGNSEGRILFFRNLGSNRLPAMAPSVALRAGGREIHMQPGYKGDIQGPGEARWGYISPNVFDWNGDGLPDILASDSTSRHYVFLNRGTKRAPGLDLDRTLYLDGLDLHGTWRVRPGVGKMDGRVAYIALDDQDQFHRYW
ncbi:MAG: VCBS repeat-containing protein, partial [Bryobacteraceae bacterium]